MHRCERCGYATKYSTGLARHLARKTPCVSREAIVTCEQIQLTNAQNPFIPLTGEQIPLTGEQIPLTGEQIPLTSERIPTEASPTCSRCKKAFSSAACLRRHTPVCKGVDTLTCPACGISFPNASQKYNHKNRGKCVPVVVQNVTTVNNHITNNITNNINVTIINASDREDWCHILEDTGIMTFINARNLSDTMSEHAISATALVIYFDPSHPENHTVRNRNVNLGTMWVNSKTGEQPTWATERKSVVLEQMTNKSIAVCSRVCPNLPLPNPETREKAKDMIEIHVNNSDLLRAADPLAGSEPVMRNDDQLLVPHGGEDFSYITDPEMDRMAFLFEASAAALLCRRHFDTARSENANLRLRTVVSGYSQRPVMEVWRGDGGWEQHDYVTPESAIVSDLLVKAVRDLRAHVDSGRCRCFPDQRLDFFKSVADCFAEPDDAEKTAVRHRMADRLLAALKDASRRRPIMF